MPSTSAAMMNSDLRNMVRSSFRSPDGWSPLLSESEVSRTSHRPHRRANPDDLKSRTALPTAANYKLMDNPCKVYQGPILIFFIRDRNRSYAWSIDPNCPLS